MRAGTIRRVSIADEYRGQDTEWILVWSGPGRRVLLTEAQQSNFQLCPSAGAFATRWLKIEFQTVGLWVQMDAVALLGTREARKDQIAVSADGVLYSPRPGLHLSASAPAGRAFDTFAFTATDCERESEKPASVSLVLGPPPTQLPALDASVWRTVARSFLSTVPTTIKVYLCVPVGSSAQHGLR